MLYGEEAENGVIKVYTKIYINKHPEESPKLSTYTYIQAAPSSPSDEQSKEPE